MLAAAIFILLIPACSILNEWGGQSLIIPHPRIICRMLGPAVVWAILSAISQTMDFSTWISSTIAVGIGMTMWATFKWGPGFMALGSTGDSRGYTDNKLKSHYWVAKLADAITGIKPSDVLTSDQKVEWGTTYMSIRGAFLILLVLMLSFTLTPWALLAMPACFLQGVVYKNSSSVSNAEYKMGAIIGGILFISAALYIIANL